MIRLIFTRRMHGFRVGTSQTDSNTARGDYIALYGLLLPGAGRAANWPRPRRRGDRYTHLYSTHDHPILYPVYAQSFIRAFCYPNRFANRDDHLDPQPDVYTVCAADTHRHAQSNGYPNLNQYAHRDGDPLQHAVSHSDSAHVYAITLFHAYASSANRDGYGYQYSRDTLRNSNG